MVYSRELQMTSVSTVLFGKMKRAGLFACFLSFGGGKLKKPMLDAPAALKENDI